MKKKCTTIEQKFVELNNVRQKVWLNITAIVLWSTDGQMAQIQYSSSFPSKQQVNQRDPYKHSIRNNQKGQYI